MPDSPLAKKRYLRLLRCSTTQQGETSIPGQAETIDSFARKHDMVFIDDVIGIGISAVRTANRRDIEQIIARKRLQNDFDVVIVHDFSRFSRGGAVQTLHFIFELRKLGVRIVSATEDFPEGETGDLMAALKHGSNYQNSKTTSLSSVRGNSFSRKEGRRSYCGRTPYGVDRLLIKPDGTPRCILRTRENGVQEMLDPASKNILMTFQPNNKVEYATCVNHYQKLKEDRVVLMPGDPKQVDVVNQMFYWWYKKHWRTCQIVEELNRTGVANPTGRAWTPTSVTNTLHNPIYVGRSISFRSTRALFASEGIAGAEERNVPMDQIINAAVLPLTYNPKSKWLEREEKAMLGFLKDPTVRKRAMLEIDDYLSRHAAGICNSPGGNRHYASPFLLSGILHTGSYPLIGQSVSNKGRKKIRYYRVSSAREVKDAINPAFRTLVRADWLENAIFQHISEALTNKEFITKIVEKWVREKKRRNNRSDQKYLISRQSTLKRRIEALSECAGETVKEVLKEKMEQYGREYVQIRTRLQALDASQLVGGTTKTIVERAVGRLMNLYVEMKASPQLAKGFMHSVIADLVIKLPSKRYQLTLKIPHWIAGKGAAADVCLVPSSRRKTGNQTSPDDSVLMTFAGEVLRPKS